MKDELPSPETGEVAARGIVWAVMPYRRNQDYVLVRTDLPGAETVISLTDGWNQTDMVPGDDPGRDTAVMVARNFPELFLAAEGLDDTTRAVTASVEMQQQVINKYPESVSAVGTFVIGMPDRTVLLFIGKGYVLEMTTSGWKTPDGIRDHTKPEEPGVPDDVKNLIGRGEFTGDGIHDSLPDVVVYRGSPPTLFLATDGLMDLMTIEDLSSFTAGHPLNDPPAFRDALVEEIQKRRAVAELFNETAADKEKIHLDDIAFIVVVNSGAGLR